MAKRPARDPNAPKRNMSAYLLYQNAMRDQFKAMNPGMVSICLRDHICCLLFPQFLTHINILSLLLEQTFGQLAKYTSAMYSELPPSEKDAWVARAEADKARYLHELAGYVPPPGYDSKGDAIVNPVATKGGRKGKPEKDINAPKRNVSPSEYLQCLFRLTDSYPTLDLDVIMCRCLPTSCIRMPCVSNSREKIQAWYVNRVACVLSE